MPSNLVWNWPLHLNSNISYVFMEKDALNCKRGHAIIGFNHALPCYVENMALGPQSRQKPAPTASVFVYLSPSGHVFNIAWQDMFKTYTKDPVAACLLSMWLTVARVKPTRAAIAPCLMPSWASANTSCLIPIGDGRGIVRTIRKTFEKICKYWFKVVTVWR